METESGGGQHVSVLERLPCQGKLGGRGVPLEEMLFWDQAACDLLPEVKGRWNPWPFYPGECYREGQDSEVEVRIIFKISEASQAGYRLLRPKARDYDSKRKDLWTFQQTGLAFLSQFLKGAATESH